MLLLKDAAPEVVKEIQSKLIKLGLLEPPVDGIPGPKTHKAWSLFKRSVYQNNLNAIGPASLELLDKATPETLVTIEQLELGFKRRPSETQFNDLLNCCTKFEVNTKPRLCHFLAQIGHETAGLKYDLEIASGAAYEGRKDLGNTQPGDGRKYKGAGAIMLTGRANYLAFSKVMNDPRVMEGCKYVAEHYFFSSAGWFWDTRNLNKLVDQGASVAAITRIVNGGQNGLADRVQYYNRFKNII